MSVAGLNVNYFSFLLSSDSVPELLNRSRDFFLRDREELSSCWKTALTLPLLPPLLPPSLLAWLAEEDRLFLPFLLPFRSMDSLRTDKAFASSFSFLEWGSDFFE